MPAQATHLRGRNCSVKLSTRTHEAKSRQALFRYASLTEDLSLPCKLQILLHYHPNLKMSFAFGSARMPRLLFARSLRTMSSPSVARSTLIARLARHQAFSSSAYYKDTSKKNDLEETRWNIKANYAIIELQDIVRSQGTDLKSALAQLNDIKEHCRANDDCESRESAADTCWL